MPDTDCPATEPGAQHDARRRESSEGSTTLARRPFLRRTGGVVVGSLGIASLADTADAGMIVELDVKSTINIESHGVIPAVVKGVAPMFLPVPAPGAPETIVGPRFGPTRLFEFECDSPGEPAPEPIPQQDTTVVQQQDDALCALQEAIDKDIGATPAHGDGHRQDTQSAMLHFRTQEAGFVPEDVQNGQVEVTLLYAVESDGDVEAFVGTDVAGAVSPTEGVAPMD